MVRLFAAFFLSIMGLALALHGSEVLGALIAAVGRTFLTVMWMFVRTMERS
jgi:hypothetical protein